MEILEFIRILQNSQDQATADQNRESIIKLAKVIESQQQSILAMMRGMTYWEFFEVLLIAITFGIVINVWYKQRKIIRNLNSYSQGINKKE